MRIYTLALTASTWSLLRDTTSSGTVNFSLTKGNLPAKVDFSGGVNNSALAEQPLVVHKITSGEERADFPIVVHESVVEDAVATLVTAMHLHHRYVGLLNRLSVPAKEHVAALDRYAIRRYLDGRYPDGLTDAARQHVIELSGLSENLNGRSRVLRWVNGMVLSLQQMRLGMSGPARATWLKEGKSPGQVLKELAIAKHHPLETLGESTNPFASPDLLVLIEYIKEYKQMYKPEYTLLDAFLEGFDGAPKLVEFLSTAILSQFKGEDAQNMMVALLEGWAKKGKEPKEVAEMLRMDGEEAVSPWLENTLRTYKVYYDAERGNPPALSHV